MNKTTAFKLQTNETEQLELIYDAWRSRKVETKHTSLQISAESTASGGGGPLIHTVKTNSLVPLGEKKSHNASNKSKTYFKLSFFHPKRKKR